MAQDWLRANSERPPGLAVFVSQEGIDKLRYVVDIAANSVLSGSVASGDRLPALAAVYLGGQA